MIVTPLAERSPTPKTPPAAPMPSDVSTIPLELFPVDAMFAFRVILPPATRVRTLLLFHDMLLLTVMSPT